MTINPDHIKAAANALEERHWDGNGCGDHGTSACSNCFGPSPESAEEVARIVLEAAIPDIIREDHERLSRLFDEKAKNVDIYVGHLDNPGDGYRDCAFMVTLDPGLIRDWDEKRDE